MHLDRYERVEEFLADAGAFLAEREAEHNLILGISSSLRRDPNEYDGPPYLATVTDHDHVAAAALRTPPYNLILSEVDDPAALRPLLADLAQEQLPGVTGPPGAVRAFADGWVAQFGGAWDVLIRERIFRLAQFVAPRPADGAARVALRDDRPVIERWMLEFGLEALNDADAERVRLGLDDWERGNGRRFWLWEVDGRPVSIVGAGGETPNGIRIGPVYTPPSDRGHGFASNLTASVSRALMAEGRRYCFLYTNLANATANKIYQAIGYEPVTDALMVAFTR
ncbi:MAG TPA: GNAT family N-acetyltransferase [Candidatus Limnocylindrales bacterium]|nr:GNAT family N-acetyltransferase [Candidatus Limnocylindrales bacterium]